MKRIYITLGILLAISLGFIFWWKNGTSPVNPSNKTPKIFIIEPGQGVRAIAKNLKDQELIKDPIVFFLLTKKMGIDSKIQAGDYRLFQSMSASQIASEFTHGTLDIWITIPEGQRGAEIAEVLKEKMPGYNSNWDQVLDQNEGYLFPDTYLFPKDSTVENIIAIMKKNFDTKFSTVDKKNTNLSDRQIVILASLIEREAKHDEDRPKVASVIKNRLDIGMKLDIDATLQYALGYQEDEKRWWKKSLTNADKKINSPYNTYAIAGLPPTPISNPGIESLSAAANPADTDYFYYLTDSSGTNRYAKTLEEHEANISKYGL